VQIRFGSRRKFRFSDRKHPMTGIISVIIGIVALISLIVLFLISSSVKGSMGIVAGFLGMFVLISSIVGFILAAKCYKKEDIYMDLALFINKLMLDDKIITYNLYKEVQDVILKKNNLK